MKKPKQIFLGKMPEVFGYGIAVLSWSEDECMKIMMKDYKDSFHARNGYKTTKKDFEERFEYYGGSINQITIGDPYMDDFNN